jgi:hypothetical protein
LGFESSGIGRGTFRAGPERDLSETERDLSGMNNLLSDSGSLLMKNTHSVKRKLSVWEFCDNPNNYYESDDD